MRLAHERFRVVTGGAHGMVDVKWFRDRLPSGTAVVDLTSAYSTIGLWGPKAKEILASVTCADVSKEGFAFCTCREISVGVVPVLASRISYVGEFGWELYVPLESGAVLWAKLLGAGAVHGVVPVGIGVYGTTGRIEKGYRAFGAELDGERFDRRGGHAASEGQGGRLRGPRGVPRPARRRTQDDPVHADRRRPHLGQRREAIHAGGEPIVTRDGAILTDGHGKHPYVTSPAPRRRWASTC
jgi:glycine cleavage system aminomethyltransferase T